MLRRGLIANRGEIALRIIRACRDLGVEAVAVYSEADKDMPYVQLADDSVCIGPAPAAESYLNIPRIIAAAEIADVDAVHPGYGFLAENAHFAEVCQECELKFIGPPAHVIADCGNKSRAKALAISAGVPVVPGSEGSVDTVEEATTIAGEIGYPVIIKAASGGGGRGMRVATDEASVVSGYHQAQAEALAAFSDGTVYIEKFVQDPRHVEFQIMADAHGKIIHLGERDCSIQRRHQKLIEETPSPALTPELRERMGASAIAFAEAAGYENAGTVEFLLDRDGNYYFIELNARIQVEHSVTEMVTGVDLVRWQLKVAAGEPLTLNQEDVQIAGHAIEFRINAENPERGFAPTPGYIQRLVLPGGPGVRMDTHLAAGTSISQHYDSMIAKLMVLGKDRRDAIRVGRRALSEVLVEGPGIHTTTQLHLDLLARSEFVSGDVDTGFLERILDD